MTPLSVTVITKNEAAHIEACLRSVAWADDVLVVDSGSTDDTVARARVAGARVVSRPWPGYAAQKNAAAAEAKHDWILSIDADERVSPALADEIRERLARVASADAAAGVAGADATVNPDTPAGFRVPRVTWHLGRWIRTTDWYPDYQLRLYDRRRARWAARRVHESVTADGPVRVLAHDLEHYAYRDVGHHHQTMDRYTTLAAEEMFERGRRAHAADLVIHPPAAFLRNYVLRRGFADGLPGFIISAMNAYYVFLKFAKLYELAHADDPGRAARS